MAAAAFIGCFCTGHGCWHPRPGVTFSTDVKINGLGAHRVLDVWLIHCCPLDGCHASIVKSGASNVSINGRSAARMGDSIACGSLIAMGSPNVNIGAPLGALGVVSMFGGMFSGFAAGLGIELPSIPSVGDVFDKLGIALPEFTEVLEVAGVDVTKLINEKIQDILSTSILEVASLVPSGGVGKIGLSDVLGVAIDTVSASIPDFGFDTEGLPSLEEAILGNFPKLDGKVILEAIQTPVLTSAEPHGFGTGDMVILKNSGSDTNGS
jgi:uncharacterized Zn-binding protein involved in type VI secretion